MSRRTTTAAASVALVAALLGACTRVEADPSDPSASPVPVKVAFFEDGSAPGAMQVITPSNLALRLALSQAGAPASSVVTEVVDLDTEGDAARAVELAHEVAADPSYIAALIGPFWAEPVAVGSILDGAGVPTLSLSGLGPRLPRQGWASWHRLVPSTRREVGSFASALRATEERPAGICVLGDGSAYSRSVATMVTREIGGVTIIPGAVTGEDPEAAGSAIERMRLAGCGAVAWTGFAPGAVALRTAMAGARMGSVGFLGTSALKADAFLTATAGTAEGTIVTCGCVDLASSTDPEAGRFIHDFQSEYGSPPGPYAAEAWDAAGMLLAAFSQGVGDRTALTGALSRPAYRGVANTYRFAGDGELDAGSTQIHVFRAEGVRWVPVGEPADPTELPVGTPGYLSMAACRAGRPFVYRQSGRFQGFDVEFARTIARRLGLSLSWSEPRCDAAIQRVADGSLDAVIAPSTDVAQGTPTTGVALSVHAAFVTTRAQAAGSRPFLGRLGDGDVVAVVGDRQLRSWARTAVASRGATVRMAINPVTAYRRLSEGRLTAVVASEPDAWAAVERRAGLVVAQGVDIGEHDVIVAKGPDAVLVAAIDEALGRLIRSGRYALLFAKYFPGTPVPPETGS